jgi:hypothetical protein
MVIGPILAAKAGPPDSIVAVLSDMRILVAITTVEKPAAIPEQNRQRKPLFANGDDGDLDFCIVFICLANVIGMAAPV